MLRNLAEYYIQQKRHRGKSRLVRLLMRTMAYPQLRSHYGPVLCCDPSDKTNVYAISGDYGYVIANHIKSLPQDSVFIDIGANYGLFTLLAAGRLTQGKVIAFEPNPEIYRRLYMARQLNGKRNIMLYNCAVGPKNGIMELRYDKNHSGLSRLVSAEEKANDNAPTVKVQVINIADYDELKALNDNPSIHVKIDVEGYEAAITEILRQAPWYKNIKSIVVEIDDKNLKSFGSSAAALYDALTQDGFKPAIGLTSGKHYDEIFSR